ncbi:hypothetical protein B0H17DRAFT_1208353 [Mycena rosella]|uniref:C3H1-type domain-containing protein n=1 Tax=Mycena rosella TaxID=1033263 RepID=A0AAD7G792_MYCRO|nr:hypothetical protein B0H17DRAFT_1208353 [Mycena rosella]
MSENGPTPSNSLGGEILPPSNTGGNPQSGDGSGGPQNPGAQSGNPQNQASAGPAGNPTGGGSPRDCEVIVDQYRRQRVPKSKALHEIYQKLLATGVGDAFNIEAAFSSFLKAIDDHDQQERSAADRGGDRVPARDAGAPGPGPRRSPTPPAFERPVLYRTSFTERSESLGGGLELRFRAVAPTKLVNDAGTWTIAFDRMHAAMLFIFPHHARELNGYRDYIISLFAATSNLFHCRIIEFDKAARKHVTQRRDIEFTDFVKFMDIKTAVIDSIGVGVLDAQRESSSGAARKSKSEACNNWNSGRCTANAGACRRLHICNLCKTAGHKGPDCPDHPWN